MTSTHDTKLSLKHLLWLAVVMAVSLATLVVGGALQGAVSGGGYVGGHLGIVLGGGSYEPGAGIDRNYVGGFAGGMLGGVTAGLVCGIGQWLVIRRLFLRPAFWIMATVGGFALGGGLTAGGYVGASLGRFLATSIGRNVGMSTGLADSIGLPLGWLISLALFGFALGACQWLAMRDRITSKWLWVFASSAGWAAGWALGYATSKLLGWPLSNTLFAGVEWPVNVALGEGVGWVVGWLAVGVIIGAAFLSVTAQPTPNLTPIFADASQPSVAQVSPATPQSDGL